MKQKRKLNNIIPNILFGIFFKPMLPHIKLFLLMLVLANLCHTSHAQNNIVKVNPLGLVFGISNLGIEFAGKKNQSITVAALYYSKSNIQGFGIGLEQRFYFMDAEESLRGFHAGPSVGYLKLKEDYYDEGYEVFSIGGEIGHQWFLNKHLTADLFSGLGFLVGSESNTEKLSFGIGISLGYAW